MPPVRQFVVLHRLRRLNHPSPQDRPRRSSFVNRGTRGVARPRLHPAVTLTGAACAQANIGQILA